MSYNIGNFDSGGAQSAGVDGSVQLSDGGGLFKSVDGVSVSDQGVMSASAYLGDGGLLSNVSGGGGSATLQEVTENGATTNREITVSNNLVVTGNLSVGGNIVYANIQNLIVDDPIIQLANNSVSDTADTGIILVRPTSNIAFGYRGDESEVMLGFSHSSAYGTDLVPLDDNLCNLKVYGSITATGDFLGDGGTLSNVTLGGVSNLGNITSNTIQFTNTETSLVASGNITVSGNVTAANFLGDGGTLSNVTLGGVSNLGNITSNTIQFTNTETSLVASGNITVSGNVTAANFMGDGGTLSNVTLGGVSNLGNITSNTIQFTNTETSLVASGNITVSGNVTAANFLGDGGTLSNVTLGGVSNLGNITSNTIQFTNTETSLVASGNITVSGNVTAANFLGDGGTLSNVTLGGVSNLGNITSNTIQFTNTETSLVASGNITVSGNVTAANFLGDGGTLSNVTLGGVSNLGNITSNTIQFTNTETSLVASGNITVSGNVTAANFLGDGGTLSNVTLGGVSNLGNITSNTIQFTNTETSLVASGNITVSGNVTAANFLGDGGTLSNVTLGGVSNLGNITSNTIQFTNTETSLVASGNITVSGNVTAANFLGDGGTLSNVTLGGVSNLGNITSNTIQFTNTETSLVASGNITVSGNVTAANFLGDGGTLSNVTLGGVSNLGNITSNTIQFTNTETSLVASGNITVSGNVTAANFMGDGGTLSNVTLGGVSNLGNITSNTIQFTNTETSLVASGNITVSGNVTAANFLGDGGTLSNVTLGGVSNLGNITSNTIQFTNTETSLVASGNITVSGNVTAANFLGDGGTLSNVTLGGVSNLGNITSNTIQFTNTETSLVASGNITVSGNVTAANFLGDGGTLSNVTLGGVSNLGNITSNTIQFTNTETSLVASGNIVVSGTGLFSGDGGLLSNVPGASISNLQQVTDTGNTTSNTIQFTNLVHSIHTLGNVSVNGADQTVATLSVKSDQPAVFAVESTHVGDLAGIGFRSATTGTGGNVPALGCSSNNFVFFTGFPSALAVTIDEDKDVTVVGNVNATEFLGDGGTLSNVTLQRVSDFGNTTSNTIQFTNTQDSLIASGNIVVTGTGLFSGDGGLLSNVPGASVPTLQQVVETGNTTANTVAFSNVGTSLIADGNITVSGNVTAANFLGDGGTLSNITLQRVSDLGNTTSNTIQFTNTQDSLIASGNIVVTGTGLFSGDGGLLSNVPGASVPTLQQVVETGNTTANTVAFSNVGTSLIADGNITVSGNVTAANFLGDGGILSNVTLQGVSDLGNTTSNTIQFTNPTTALTTDLNADVEIKLNQLTNVNINGLTENNLLIYDGTNWVNDVSVRNFTKIINKTGGTLFSGNTVYIYDGHNANVANVALADATDPTKMPAIGLVYQDITDGNEGFAVSYGKVQGIDLDGFLEGETLYVSNTQVGGISNVKPTLNADLIQNVGIVVVTGSNGTAFVTGVGRTNDIPNGVTTTTQSDIINVYGETSTNRFAKISQDNLRSNLQQVTNSDNVTTNTVEFLNTETSLVASGNIEVTGNVTAANFFGDGGTLSNVTLQRVSDFGNTTSNTIQFTNTETSLVASGNIEVTGNVTAANFFGDGGTLSNVTLQRVSDFGNTTSNTIQFTNSDTSLITSGKIGIGVSEPDYAIDVQGTIRIKNGGVDRLIFNNSAVGDISELDSIVDGGTGGAIGFRVKEAGGSITERFRISQTGNVGIGTTNPTSRLHVVGTSNILTSGSVGITVNDTNGVNIYGKSGVTNNLHNDWEVVNGSITATEFLGDGGTLSNVTLQRVSDFGNTTSNTIQFTGTPTSLTASGNIEVTGTGLFLGNGNLISNTVNSDITPGTYGSATQVAQIVVSSDNRISSISEVTITGGGGGGGSYGTYTFDSSNVLDLEFDSEEYKYFVVNTISTNVISDITFSNVVDGSKGYIDIQPTAGSADLDIFASVGSSSVKTSLYSNAIINSASHCILTTFTVFSNTFISFSEYN